ncbi:hypothetical protein LPJ56_000803 [Coemansia sp. RSA 2599]|nr:hypothetical protein LPJ75_000432 [Coemansia sp. RSA 2598]KAJ1828893.1 hypothetical protein LPJ56_000803 [Coemansia sp. RSA 2599]
MSEEKFEYSAETVSEYERAGCPEFFLGKAAKTPERYMTIRNHIVGEWLKIRPQYLTKIRARSGLRNCGDVNAIGRVHSFLEDAGVINQGAMQTKRKRAAVRRRMDDVANGDDSDDDGVYYGRPRRTRGHGSDDNGDGDGDGGGHVVEHNGVIERRAQDDGEYRCSSDSSGDEKRGRRKRKNGGRWQWVNSTSEFRLVPCHAFAEQPYALRISAAALALMDLHAHLTHSEVIGLLGGRFEDGVIHVDVAFACAGAGSATECEMDPAAEVAARRLFSKKNLAAIGWFHSHPTFEPTPSVRDIATQRAYQSLCRQPDGIEPFVGVIVSPPGGSGPYGVSDISVFCVPRESPEEPYGLPYEVVGADSVPSALVDEMEALVKRQAAALTQRADLSRRFRRSEAMTALEKLVISLRSHWHESVRQEWDEAVSLRLRPLLTSLFCKKA